MPSPEVTRWRNVFVMSGTILFTLTGIYCWHRVLALYLRKVGASEDQIAIGWFFLLVANRIPQIFGGWLADRMGRKRIVAVITTLMGLCYLAIGMVQDWRLVIALISLCWILGGLQWPALLSLVADSVPEHQRGRAMGLLEAASMTGLTVGPLLGGLVLERHPLMQDGWWILLGACAVFYLGSAFTRGLFLVETSTVKTDHSFLSRLRVIDWRILAFPVAVYVLAMWVDTLVKEGPFQSLYLADVNGLNESSIEYVNAAGGLAAIASALISGWLSDRLGAGRVIRISFALMFAALVPFLLPLDLGVGKHPGWAVAAFIAVFVPAEMFTVAYQKLVTSVAPEGSRALYVGAAGLSSGLFIPWCSPVGMALYDSKILRGPFWLAAGISVAGLLLPFVLRAGRKPRPSPAPSSPAAD